MLFRLLLFRLVSVIEDLNEEVNFMRNVYKNNTYEFSEKEFINLCRTPVHDLLNITKITMHYKAHITLWSNAYIILLFQFKTEF